MDVGVALHLANERPVGIARIHLTTGTAVDGQRLNAALLQLFGQRGDDELFVVPTQASLNGNGQANGVDHALCDLEHLGDVLQHACTSTLAGDFLHRTAEVKVYQVWTGLFDHLCRLDHCLDVTTIDLDTHRTLLVADGQLANGRLHVANQRLGRDKLCIHHRGAKALAQHAEADVGHVFHRCEEDGTLAQIYVTYLHIVSF